MRECTITGADWARSLREARPRRRQRAAGIKNQLQLMTLEKIEAGAARLAMDSTGSGEDVRELAGLVAGLAATQRGFMQAVHDRVCMADPALAEKVGAVLDGGNAAIRHGEDGHTHSRET